MKTGLRIRAVKPADTAAILDLTTGVFAPASIDARIQARIGGTDWKKIKCATVERELNANPRGCFVAVRGDRIAGYVTTVVNDLASRGTIANLAVAADCQGQGLGRRLLAHALRHFRRLNLRHAKIETLADNAAGQKLYPSLGFQEVARQIHYAMPLD